MAERSPNKKCVICVGTCKCLIAGSNPDILPTELAIPTVESVVVEEQHYEPCKIKRRRRKLYEPVQFKKPAIPPLRQAIFPINKTSIWYNIRTRSPDDSSDCSELMKSVPIADAAFASKSDTELSTPVERASTSSDVKRATGRGRDMPSLGIHECQARTDLCVPLSMPPLHYFCSDDDPRKPRRRVELIAVEPQINQPRLSVVEETDETIQSNDDLTDE